jgi:PAS domain S-box-containing protein
MRSHSQDERALRAQADLIELTPDAILVREIGSGAVLFWNRGAQDMYGWRADEALGQVSHELLQTVFPRPIAEIEAELVQLGHWEGELVHVTRDGKRLVVASRWAVQTDDEQRPVAFLEVNTDVTEQRIAAAEQTRLLHVAEAASAQFEGLLESAPDGVVIVDRSGHIKMVNRQTEVLFGYPRAELLGRTVDMLLPERFRTRHPGERAAYTREPRTRPMGSMLELFGRHRDGSEFPVEISLSPMDSSGELLVISTIRDITPRKESDARLRAIAADLTRSNAELEQFAYVASHDLQEPLRMVASYTQLLARRYAGKLDQDADEFIGFAVDGARRMQELINDLLTYSRAGTRPLHLQPVDTGHLVDQVVSDFAVTIDDRSARVTRDELPTVHADAPQLRQVFQNLIANGLKFRRSGVPPHVHISARREGHGWTFATRDNGIGIEPQYIERIFVLFQRLHTRADYPGTGIGLAICKKIVERHGGLIRVESVPEHGTTFSFTLPARPVNKGEG